MAATRHPTFTINHLHTLPITHTSTYNMADTRHPTFTITHLHARPITHTSPYNMVAITHLHEQQITIQHGRRATSYIHHYQSTRPTNHNTTWPPPQTLHSTFPFYIPFQSHIRHHTTLPTSQTLHSQLPIYTDLRHLTTWPTSHTRGHTTNT
jgi:hypothetical protein